VKTCEAGFSAADGPVSEGLLNEYLESEMRTDEGPVSHAYVRESAKPLGETSVNASAKRSP
jgi:hypothetical protein